MVKIKEEILGTFVATPKPTGPKGVISAIHKDNVDTMIVNAETLDGDDTYDKRFHGGPHRVVHHYTQKNYQHLKDAFPEIAEKFVGGSYGENILTQDLDETQLCVGDIFTVGTARLQLTIPRSPCGTINMGYEHNKVLKHILTSGHFGWFYKVLETGEIKKGDQLELIERPYPNMNLHKFIREVYRPSKAQREVRDIKFLTEASTLDVLDDDWTGKVQKALS
jgi:MOSC domain-containing protein YiiM